MTLADLLPSLPLPYGEARQYGLVFQADLAARLEEVQADEPSKFRAVPVLLIDGRFFVCGDLLSEVGPGGLYAAGFAKLNAARFDEIEVLAWADAVALVMPPAE